MNGIDYFKRGVNIDDEHLALYQLEVIQFGVHYDEVLHLLIFRVI
jgi:hypothetical protein